jgi:hypothetical protein
MKPPADTGPPGLQVQRAFEGQRLAQESQARAYQQVLAVGGQSPTTGSANSQLGRDQPPFRISQEGVAA